MSPASRRRALLVLAAGAIGAAWTGARWLDERDAPTHGRRMSALPASDVALGIGDRLEPGMLVFPDRDGVPVDVAARERRVFLNFWAAWCHPCLEELRMLADERALLARYGIDVVTIALDLRGNAVPMAERLRLPFQLLIAEEPDVLPLSLFGRKQLALPLSVLFDERLRVVEVIGEGIGRAEFAALLERHWPTHGGDGRGYNARP